MSGWLKRRRRVLRRAGERGALSLELAIVFPIVLLLIFTGFQASTYFFGRSLALAAAQEGVREARIQPADINRGVAAAQAYIDQTSNGTLIEVQIIPGGTAEEMRITVVAQVVDLVGGVLDLTVSQTASGPVERPSR